MEFTAETIAKALTAIYGKEFDIDSELEAHIFEETRRIFAQAAAEGIADSVEGGADVPGDEFLKALRESVDVFSAFRTHRMQNDIAAQLTDEKGQLKPFSRFAKDVQPYVRHKNRAWLRTEYDTAVRRAHQAADWQQFEAEKDVLPNLEWIPSTSPTPGADHRVFWGTVLPVDDPFWKEHRPGDRWNCKCELRATDKDCTARPSGTEKDNPQSGLENNPGKDGHLFSDKHPYYPDSCASCQYSGNKLMALFHDLAGSRKHCNSCRKVEKVVKETKGLDERKDTNRKEYERLKRDPDYINVKYDKKSGGVMATHKEHNFDPTIGRFGIPRGDYEKITQKALFKKGYAVRLREEEGEEGVKQPDGYVNDRLMDIKGIEGNPLYALNRANIQRVHTAVLYFHEAVDFDLKAVQEKWNFLPEWINNNERITNKTVYLQEVICVVRNGKDFNIYEIKNPE